eukprot:CAMPEP_0184325008 /NCGR_PEP_ID=MMETSP1049-20130417/138074_1 /TAXON_ID=77928 /ORGANISM="Proteomonas sulcata, Strain CCMP704" /LENGTH=123 /DNA_ID=CAMNT_0026646931 /DNA_START=38 /DNA_END=409 /DNA_ORIENTATION=+
MPGNPQPESPVPLPKIQRPKLAKLSSYLSLLSCPVISLSRASFSFRFSGSSLSTSSTFPSLWAFSILLTSWVVNGAPAPRFPSPAGPMAKSSPRNQATTPAMAKLSTNDPMMIAPDPRPAFGA